MVRLLSLCFISVFLSCTSSKDTAGGNDYFVERNILWFDATANFDRFCNKDSITYYLQKSKEVGITDVVVDVKPITGEVLYPSAIAPVMKSWGEGKMVKDTTWDMLSYFLTEGHKLGLKVHASTNVFVAGHNFFDRGVVYSDSTKAAWQTISYLPEGFKPITEQKSKYSAMINPALKEVRDYELSILKELVTMYPTLDGIILDRVRFDNLNADFSSESRALFETHMGQKVENFPADIFSFENKERKEGKLFKPWLEWRAKIIHDFIYETRDALKKNKS